MGQHPTTGLLRELFNWIEDAAIIFVDRFLLALADHWRIKADSAADLLAISRARAERTLANPLSLEDLQAMPLTDFFLAWLETYAEREQLSMSGLKDTHRLQAAKLLFDHCAILLYTPMQKQNLLRRRALAKEFEDTKTLQDGWALLEELLAAQPRKGRRPVAAILEDDPLAALPLTQPAAAPLATPVTTLAPTLKEIRYKAEPRNPATNKCWRADFNPRFPTAQPCSGDHDLWHCQLYICPICRIKAAGHNPPSCPHAKGKEREYHFSPQRKK